MFGDFSRRTFDLTDGYRAVLLQQGRVVLDADVNEQAEITAHHDEARTRDLVGRHGGPAGEPGPFAVVGPDGSTFDGNVAWTDLRLTPGDYYVDGVLCECSRRPDGELWKLTEQPMTPRVRRTDDISTATPVNPEPTGRQLVYLDVWNRAVAPDEDPSLLESALGGADTAVRARTTWQVRTMALTDTENADQALAKLSHPRPTMTAEPPSTPSGPHRLDNQLYRIQVHDGSEVTTGPTMLWSRDNGSVVARLLGITTLGGGRVELTVDRDGRDAESSLAKDDLVELSSTDTELRRKPGVLARVSGDPVQKPGSGAFAVPITWVSTPPPGTIDELGLCPIMRRWDCDAAVPLGAGPEVIDDRFVVTFTAAAGARFDTGDYWLVPARTVRLAYGLAAEAGTIEWPTDADGKAIGREPAGPDHRLASLAVLAPAEAGATGWSLEQDCRRLFAPVSDFAVAALQLLGGDGQEALPGEFLAEPIRVAARIGGTPVIKATVRFSVGSGELSRVPSAAGTPLPTGTTSLDLDTGDDGAVGVRWRLASGPAGGVGPSPTQVLTAELLGTGQKPVEPAVRVTARLSIAAQVGWTAPGSENCDGYAASTTAQQVLDQLVTAKELILLGGDGQSALPGAELTAPVRVAVRTGGRPLENAAVTFETEDGHLATDHAPTTGSPSTLPAVKTGASGVLSVRWLLNPEGDATQKLTVRLDDDSNRLVVTAHLDHATNVAWTPPAGCQAFAGDTHVQAALQRLVTTRQLRLLGGDGQEVRSADEVAPQPVRVIVDSPCGPVRGVKVVATPSETGRVTPVDPSVARPDSLPPRRPRARTPQTVTDQDGVAAFWWQPGEKSSATLTIKLTDDAAPIIVGATLEPGPTRGLHIEAVGFDPDDFSAAKAFRNDTQILAGQLSAGIYVKLDGDADPRSWAGKPVIHVRLDLPWPTPGGDGDPWFDEPVGTRTVELSGGIGADFDPDTRRDLLVWRPTAAVVRWLDATLWDRLAPATVVKGQFTVQGWAITAAGDAALRLNTHATTKIIDGSRTDLQLPTDDETPGGTFIQWFDLAPDARA